MISCNSKAQSTFRFLILFSLLLFLSRDNSSWVTESTNHLLPLPPGNQRVQRVEEKIAKQSHTVIQEEHEINSYNN